MIIINENGVWTVGSILEGEWHPLRDFDSLEKAAAMATLSQWRKPLITGARPILSGPCHFYEPLGKPVWTVPNKSKPGEHRATTSADARKLNLVPSPTTITKLLHRHSLVEWLCEQMALAVLTTPRKDGEGLDDFVRRVVHTDRVQDEERNTSAERGRAIHKAIQSAVATVPSVPDDGPLGSFVAPALKALEQLGRVVATEKVIVGDRYCGMADCVLENESEIWVLDFKSTGAIPAKPYEEQKLQVAAYCAGLGNTGGKRIRGALIYIDTNVPGKIETKETDWREDFKRFRLLLDYWYLVNKI